VRLHLRDRGALEGGLLGRRRPRREGIAVDLDPELLPSALAKNSW
jgi:hypothetical protein